jgi:hypothetical protein
MKFNFGVTLRVAQEAQDPKTRGTVCLTSCKDVALSGLLAFSLSDGTILFGLC